MIYLRILELGYQKINVSNGRATLRCSESRKSSNLHDEISSPWN